MYPIRYFLDIWTVSEEKVHYTFANNFAEIWSISKILSL